MEPALRGPSVRWACPTCGWEHRFCTESIWLDSPFRCPTCYSLRLEPIDIESETANGIEGVDRVDYWPRRLMAAKRLSRNEPTEFEGLKRGDLVVLQSPDQSIREVKRVVGFPGERLTIRNGDLWIGEQRWKKSIEQLLRQAVLVHSNDLREPIRSTPGEQDSVDDGSSLSTSGWTDGSRTLSGPIRIGGAEATESLPLDAPIAPALSDSRVMNQSLQLSDERAVTSLFFQMGDGGWIDNRFVVNMHDSHALVPVDDLGVAIQIENWSEEWVMRVAIRSPNRQWMTTIDVSSTDWSISSGGKESTHLISKADYEDQAVWLVIACVDGDGVVALNHRELFRGELDQEGVEPETVASSNPNDDATGSVVPVEIRCLLGDLEIGQLAILRDLHYRGAGDAPVQRFDSDEGLVLLGDNVSLSNDSRQRWEKGIGLSDIAGVIEESRGGIENLLRQREGMPKPPHKR